MNQTSIKANAYQRWFRQPLMMAILAMLGLVSLISYISYQEVHKLDTEFSSTSEIPLKKIQYLDSMVHHSRQRLVLLRDIVYARDAFEQDEIILEHQRQATQYILSRNNLEQLLSTGEEQDLMRQLIEQNSDSYQTQEKIINFALQDESEPALELIRESLGPSHDKMYKLMVQLRDLLVDESVLASSMNQQHAKLVSDRIVYLFSISIITGLVLIFLAYQVQRKHYKRLAWQATHDALTGLMNRYQFESIVTDFSLTKAPDKSCSLFYLDLDQFKLINDTVGHIAGDELLRQVASLLNEHLESNMTLSRLGGDEFSFLVADIDEDAAKNMAKKLLQNFAEFRFTWTEQTFDVSASIGIVLFKGQQMSKTELFTAADLACQTAKDAGRNCFHLYKPTDSETRTRMSEMHWATQLREAMSDNNLQVFHQPIVSTSNVASIHHTEILLRYMENGEKPVSAFKMILAAEKFGFTDTLDEYVFRKVLEHMKANPLKEMTYNVNISGPSLESPRMLSRFVTMIDEYEINPEQICFEITETVAITRYTNAQQFINILQGMGCKFALDDFGTGVSSFGYLDKLPVDMIKIDASFVQTLHVDVASRAICLAIREVAHAFGIKVVAEGVENEKIRQAVEDIGIDYVQGFGIVMPSPLDKMKMAA